MPFWNSPSESTYTGPMQTYGATDTGAPPAMPLSTSARTKPKLFSRSRTSFMCWAR
jgi:hypothetical protein